MDDEANDPSKDLFVVLHRLRDAVQEAKEEEEILEAICELSEEKRAQHLFHSIEEIQAASLDAMTERAKPVENAQVSAEPIMKFFAYAHLLEHLQKVSKPFGELAQIIVDTLPRNAERTVALRKLLESKDCAVRALV